MNQHTITLDLSRLYDAKVQLQQVRALLNGDTHSLCNPDFCLHAQLARGLGKLLPINEPKGLGAVVKDAEGRLWIRVDNDREPWFQAPSSWCAWDEVHGVELMTPGVTVP